ncbi:uncharacterized protein LOC119685460 [Teleopsis dalmanni]|uniref:uncharacterized protein LOC119685460 n=1 Tax=Teleopsis dalmanni TaxID=139649 RepID=UPI000D32CEA7|nr:uncharacterized protein LOC119685460 [Teleopsis dalmanni]
MALININKKRRGLNDEVIKALIRAVENNPTIWNRQCKEHLNNTTLRTAWKNVSEEVSLSVDDCKAAWRSVRDSKRYHEKKRKKYESNPGLLDHEHWGFHEELSFLTDNSTQHINFATVDESEDRCVTPVKQITYEPEVPNSSHSTRNSALNMLTSSAEKIITQMETFVKMKQCQQKKKSHFEPFLNLINSILEQLPEVDAQRLSAEITSMAYARLNDHLSKKIKKENRHDEFINM